MKLTSKVTYKIIHYILEKKKFRQLEIAKSEKVAFSRVNKVVNWLVSRGYVAKGKEGYRVTAPAAILNIFSLYRKMEELRVATFDVDVDRKKLLGVLKSEGAVFCLTSALQQYDDYFRDPGIHIYSDNGVLLDELSELKRGYTHIDVYKDDIKERADTTKKGGMKLTTELRTLIDLFCSDRAYAAERLVARKW